ncbi:hypothetical protein [Pedococcus sp. 2YAF34]|uniref:hypothetical protein n=1 Tax=Pedococcus sp. 2YAF34 TaxID=3233032 RepID=UPI003F9A1BB7
MSAPGRAAAPARPPVFAVHPALAPTTATAVLAAPLAIWLSTHHPGVALGLVLVGALAACVVAKPALAAYSIIVVTPLTAGIDRGSAIPMMRPNEALAAVVGGALAARAILGARAGRRPAIRLSQVEWGMLAMAVASSVLPLAWMAVRQKPIGMDDLLYALVLWKLGGVYLIVRASIRTVEEVRRALYLSVGVAVLVGAIAILQALNLFGVRALLSGYFLPNGNVGALANPRGGSTLALPAAVADLMICNLALVVGLIARRARHAVILSGASLCMVLAAVSAGEFSSALGLVIAAGLLAYVIRRPRLLLLALPLSAVVAVVAWPVISERLSGFQGTSGIPVSWVGRLRNLNSYFWPQLVDQANFLLGVRPSARVVVSSQATGYVWIESGYTWLLWGGGLPLLFAFAWFVRASVRHSFQLARWRPDAVGAAALGYLVGIVVMAVLMLFDPHLTYRGAGDALFILAALARWPAGGPETAPDTMTEGAVNR